MIQNLLNDGYNANVELIAVMGTDQSIVDAARVCVTGLKPTSGTESLIRYLMRHHHTTPFEMVQTQWRVKCPVFVARQWFRHRTWSYNEVSQRYAVTLDEMHSPDAYRQQSSSNKQGGDEVFDQLMQDSLGSISLGANQGCYAIYKQMINEGVSREQARHVLPMGTYTEFIGSVNLWNLMKFLHLRMESHAQLEIRVFANVMCERIGEICPLAMQAFNDYILEAQIFSRGEIKCLRDMMDASDHAVTPDYVRERGEAHGLSKREVDEFYDKVQQRLT